MLNEETIDRIFDAALYEISNILPSEWAEKNRYMSSDVTAMEGMYSFQNAPYAREPLDCIHPSDPARIITMLKASQLGLSTGVVENAIGWIISESPGNTLFLVGHADLVDDASKKVDMMIDNTPIRKNNLVRSSANKARKTKSGDTTNKKEFAGGELKLGIANHKYLRNISMRYGFIDDFDAMKSETKESGDTLSMVENRFKAFWKKMKLYLISSPELMESSNIYKAYLLGDQRKWFIPCPCCGVEITWEWETQSKRDPNLKAGITYKLDENNELIESSIGYTCQECGGFFDDKNKDELINSGRYIATNPKADPERVSFYMNALIAPTFMKGWLGYVKEYLIANPPNGVRDEAKHQVFVNQCLGMPYSPTGISNDSKQLKQNTRDYSPWTIPEKQSIADGNGKIILLTMASDMNGTVEDPQRGWLDDARMDWEIVAWSESGASYSIAAGSIGTFVPAHLRTDAYNFLGREKWTYVRGAPNSVWTRLDEIVAMKFKTDTGRYMGINALGLDTAPYTQYSYPYIESAKYQIYGLKGDKIHDSGIFIEGDHKPFAISKEHAKLWIVNVNRYKDVLSTHAKLKWVGAGSLHQPNDFMNFPTPQDGMYSDTGFFEHFEAEHKIIDEKTKRFIWKKKTDNAQNHFLDCRIYNMVARDLLINDIFKELGIKNGSWTDFVNLFKKRKS